uniref:TIR domain-containing protein n=1 Tax=Candidatus Kentrum sp. MB TaxID=2138164 RepID=A0A451BBZ4_9GAMM|nr:MAG: TIR domain-containing protein [Candidatus Kentron sp. MB]VFK32911.1 MAG: TIR domain-containing protein [Candidatus Kentron sp. MB]VFK75798.1 MAG: TIR domain-containing protein [Candidatus Kentron sp. MB]
MNNDRFDVFLCHNSQDKSAVRYIAKRLREKGLRPWFDEWEVSPGSLWQRSLEEQIEKIHSVAVCIGPSGMGPWQQMEVDAYLRKFVERRCPIIPVVLSGAIKGKKPQLPVFLEAFAWVDFNQKEPHPLERLIRGITEEKTQGPAIEPASGVMGIDPGKTFRSPEEAGDSKSIYQTVIIGNNNNISTSGRDMNR